MATKLGKNFGLGNSYKNVKLVKSAVKKSDSNTESAVSQAIEELKAGTLPVFKYDDTLGELTNNFTQSAYGSIILDGNLILVLISSVIVNFFVFYGGEENVTSNDHEQFIADADGDKDTTLSDAYNDATVVNRFATTTYVDNNKGTKLYRHTLSSSAFAGPTYLISNNSTPITQENITQIMSYANSNTVQIVIGYQGSGYIPLRIYTSSTMHFIIYASIGFVDIEFNYNTTSITDTVTEL